MLPRDHGVTAVRGRSARSAANHMPGFSYETANEDGALRRVRERRQGSRALPPHRSALNAQDAKRLWAAFRDEVNGESA